MLLLFATPGVTEIGIAAAFAFLIGFFITRWIFRVNTMVDHIKLQTQILVQIAKYNKVPVEELNQLLRLDNEKFPAAVGDFETGADLQMKIK